MVERPWRCFVAVPLPADVRAAIAERLALLVAATDARWVPASNLHLTLVFLGATDPADVPATGAAMAAAASAMRPFTVRLGNTGSFGGRGRPRVAWISLEAGATELSVLADSIRGRLALPEEDGVPAFRPHLTLARGGPPDLPARLEAALEDAPMAWQVDEVVLLRSHLGAGAPRYEPLLVVRVGSGEVVAGGGSGGR